MLNMVIIYYFLLLICSKLNCLLVCVATLWFSFSQNLNTGSSPCFPRLNVDIVVRHQILLKIRGFEEDTEINPCSHYALHLTST